MAGVYISWPFCAQKCTYCNFASGVFPREQEAAYASVLLREINTANWTFVPDTVYFGGGTPSQMTGETLSQVLRAIPGRPWKEATMEAAPGTFSREAVETWRESGITRVSLGVQSFVDTELRRTGRKHTAEVVAADVAMLRSAGIRDFNIDLIAGLAGQTPESWERSVSAAIALRPPHISVYMLEVDEDSRLGLEILNNGGRYGAREVPPDEAIAGMYERAVEVLAEWDIHRYEISNFAQPGAESLHNLKYWRREPYTGFGVDAHSFDGAQRWQNVHTVAEYLERSDPRSESSSADAREERFFLGLRLAEGVEPTASEWSAFAEPIERFLMTGLMERVGPRIRLTAQGILLSNEVFQEFLSA